MQEITEDNTLGRCVKRAGLPLEDKQRLVDAFAWLIQEDKKQNPALYKPNK